MSWVGLFAGHNIDAQVNNYLSHHSHDSHRYEEHSGSVGRFDRKFQWFCIEEC
jgi:hypothetical protein